MSGRYELLVADPAFGGTIAMLACPGPAPRTMLDVSRAPRVVADWLLTELNALLDRAEKAEARVAEMEREVAAWSPARHYGEEDEVYDDPKPEPSVAELQQRIATAKVGYYAPCAWCWSTVFAPNGEQVTCHKGGRKTPVPAPEGTGYPTGAADHNEVHEHHVAVYGGTRIPVAKCPECKIESFVEGGLSACCSVPIDEAVSGVRRYTRGGHRGKPNYKFQREQLDRQNHRCFWCDRAFGDPYVRAGRGKGGLKFLRVAWDHVIPIAVDGTNHEDNFVASCNVCNGFKGAKIFANETAMRAWLKSRWLAKMIPDGEVDREG
jgi:hypothetical protein